MSKNSVTSPPPPRTKAVPPTNWKFADGKNRVIVTFQDKEGTGIREYEKSKTKDEYLCVKCLKEKRTNNYAKFIDDTFHEPYFHPCIHTNNSSSTPSNSTPSSSAAAEKPNPYLITKKKSLSPDSVIFDDTPERKSDVSTPKQTNAGRSTSPLEVVYSTPRSGKPKITSFYKQKSSPSQSTPTRSRPKSKTVETPTQFKENPSTSDEKENDQQQNDKNEKVKKKSDKEKKNRKIKRTTFGDDDVTLIEADESEDIQDVDDNVNSKVQEKDTICIEDDVVQPDVPDATTFNASVPASDVSTNEFREVDTCMYQYGFNEKGDKKAILMVRENDRQYARVYTVVEGEEFKCLNCETAIAKKNENGTFLVSTKHGCTSILWASLDKKQKLLQANYHLSLMKKSPATAKKSKSRKSEASFQSSIDRDKDNSSSSSAKFRKLSSNQWEWGYDSIGKEKMRIIVYDLKNKEDAYEYRNYGKKILCLGCQRGDKQLYGAKSDDDIPIISVPPEENHVCKPRSMKEIREQQKRYVEKVKKRPRTYEDSEDEDYGKRTRRSDANNELDNSKIEEEETTPRRSSRFYETSKNLYDDTGKEKTFICNTENNEDGYIDPDLAIPSADESEDEEIITCKRPQRSKIIESDSETSTSQVAQDLDNSASPLSAVVETVQDEPISRLHADTVPRSTIQKYPSSNLLTTVRFFNPSSDVLEKCCDKLRIPYSPAAYKFWGRIYINKVASTSIPNESNPVIDESGFACFSLFLTGTETNALAINFAFNKHFFTKNLAKIGDYYGENFSRTDDEKTVGILYSKFLTKYHFQALCQFFECRIGVFVDGKWERYGNWDDEAANVLTFLMQKENEKFCPILSLMK